MGCQKEIAKVITEQSVLRHIALNLLRRESQHKRGIKARRKRAGWDRGYLLQVLTA